MAFTTLSSTLLKISGQQIGPGGSIAAGTAITSARLTTIDQDDGAIGQIQINFDAYTLSNSETISFLINGQQVATTLPKFFATTITTNAGTFTALAFVVGNDTYLLPQGQQNISAITTITRPATLNSVTVNNITAADYGLVPENANTFVGQVYTEVREFGQTNVTSSLASASIYDADRIRGNADSVGEEVGTGPLNRIGEAKEVLATLAFKDGTTLTGVEAVISTSSSAYGPTVSRYLFNEADLAAAGKSLADIARVTSTTSFDHALNWEDLGFDFSSAGNGIVTPDPTPAPLPTVITGNNSNNSLTGTAGSDVIRGLGGNDTLRGGADSDYFVFGNETRNGRRETDTVSDYEIGKDTIVFEDNAIVQSVRNISGGVQITFAGDGDKVNVLGAGVTTSTVQIFADDIFPFI